MGNSVSIANTSIAINAEGMYNLNDLHKAAMSNGKATDSQRPSNFIKSQADFITAAKNATGVALKQSKGRNGGTWADELVAMKYAGWIEPAYEVEVYQAFQALKHGDVERAVAIAKKKTSTESLDAMRRARAVSMQTKSVKALFELLPDLSQTSKQAIAAGMMNMAAGYEMLALPNVEEMFTTTDVAEFIGVTANKLGRIANEHNMKIPEHGEYRLSKSQHSDKQVEQWHWSARGKYAMEELVKRLRETV